MWSAGKDSIRWLGEGDALSFSVLHPDYISFSGETLFPQKQGETELGYDDWVQRYSRDEEGNLIKKTIDSLRQHPRRVHIAGVSCTESIDLLGKYYSSLGYEDTIAHAYTLPSDVLLTVSISLRHLLWCEKDKAFLQKKDSQGNHYYALVPPLRSPRDLRVLQQAVRMGIIPCIDVGADISFISQVMEKQILTPFQISQCVGWHWQQYGFSGTQTEHSISLPCFPSEEHHESFL